MTPKIIWEKAQPHIKEQVGETTYETWFSALKIKEEGESSLVIDTPDDFFKNWIIDHYLPAISSSLQKINPLNIEIEFVVNPEIFNSEKEIKMPSTEEVGEKTNQPLSQVNSRFSFDNFVIGPSNRFASAACMAVAESPAKAYNPLFIYGQVGLGKTHLMQAIANKIRSNNKKIKHCYLSSEKFTNELINAIRNRSTQQFRQKYRNIDVLLIDDIHFIAGKESTQEEFFHTFNALHDNRKQIIISSDRPPKEIAKLEERLTSRFAWGLITDIQPPDFETRVAILRKKIEQEPVKMPDEVILFIAQQIKSNIRELEGALIRVSAYSLLEEREITLDMAKIILKDLLHETIQIISVETIQKHVAEFFNIAFADLKTVRRNKNIVLPRQVAMYLSRKLTKNSLPEIGKVFGGKDHTTVLHSCKKIEQLLEKDQEMKYTIEKLITKITP